MDVSVPYVTWKRGVNYGKAQMNGFFQGQKLRKFLKILSVKVDPL